MIEERQVLQMQRHELQQQVAASGMTDRKKNPLNLTTQRVGRVPCQSDDTSEDDSTSAAPDDTSDDDSTSVAPDDTSDDDSTSAAPPLLSAGETSAGKTLPSVSVPPIVGSKAREQRVSDVTAKVDAKRSRSQVASKCRGAGPSTSSSCRQLIGTAATGSPSRATSAARPACCAGTSSRARLPRDACRSRVASESKSQEPGRADPTQGSG